MCGSQRKCILNLFGTNILHRALYSFSILIPNIPNLINTHYQYPGVYAEVSAGYDFIQQIVCQESEDVNARDAFQCSGSAEAAIAPSGGGGSASQGDDDFNYDDFGSSFGGVEGGSGSSGNPGSGGSLDDYIDDDWSDDYNYDDGNYDDDDDSNYDDRWYDDNSYDDQYDDRNYAYDDSSLSGQSYGGGGGGGWTGSMASWWSNLWH
jgi:hypothetical protein